MICSLINRYNYKIEICKNGNIVFVKQPEMIKLKTKREVHRYIKDLSNILEICEEN